MRLILFAYSPGHPSTGADASSPWPYFSALVASAGGGAEGTRTCKYVLNTLMHSFTAGAMAVEITEGVLRDLATKLLLWLLNTDLPRIEEGTALLKALNMLMLKVLPW